MKTLSSITAVESLLNQIAGRHDNEELKADLALASAAMSLVVQTLVLRVDPKLNLDGIDQGLAKAIGGISDTINALDPQLKLPLAAG